MKALAGLSALALCACASVPPQAAAPGPYAPGAVSGLLSEVKLAVRPDGLQEVWGIIRPDGNLDLVERHLSAGGAWTSPADLGLNTTGEDFDPAFSRDGKQLYFHSDRDGGYGKTDIYVAQAAGNFTFGEARNLGPSVNSAGAEWAAWPLPDGTLLMASDGWGGAGAHDLFLADPARPDSRPQPLGGPLAGPEEDFDAAMSRDGRTLVFSRGSMSDEAASVFLYRSRRLPGGRWSEPERLPLGCGDFTIGAAFLPDGSFAYASNCGSGGQGRMDIYRTRLAE